MTDFVPEASASSSTVDLLAVANVIMSFVVNVQRTIARVRQSLEASWKKAERDHQRAARLKAYRLRHRWKKGDEGRLQAVGISEVARRRFNRIKLMKGRGRPVVPRYHPLGEQFIGLIKALDILFSPSTPPHLRRRVLKQTNWWPYCVEAVYRGEYEAAKAEGRRASSTVAEERTGEVFGIAPDTVRKIAGRVRKARAQETGLPDPQAVRASDFEVWERTGRLRETPCRHLER